jgi:hypothetical protein
MLLALAHSHLLAGYQQVAACSFFFSLHTFAAERSRVWCKRINTGEMFFAAEVNACF